VHQKDEAVQDKYSSDILSIRFKHTCIIRFFGLFKKYLIIVVFVHCFGNRCKIVSNVFDHL
jgi:hypothetical protein